MHKTKIVLSFSIFIFSYNLYFFYFKKNKNKTKVNGIAFGPTGCYCSYQLGIAKYIQNKFSLDRFKYAGISGGSQSALCLALNIPVDDFFNNVILKTFNKKNNIFTVFQSAKVNLKNYLEENNIDLNVLDDNFFIGITVLNPLIKSKICCNFKNYDDMFDCMITTQYIPFIFGSPYFIYNKEYCLDGYISNYNFIPTQTDNWLNLDIHNINNYYIYKFFFLGIFKMFYICNSTFHIKQYKKGYLDAKKFHSYFVKRGLIEK